MKRAWSVLFSLVLIASLLGIGGGVAQAGAPDQWTQVPLATPDSPNTGVSSLAVFQGKLFAATKDYENGLRVWRMEKDRSWTQVSQAGFGNPLLSSPEQMIVYNDYLYIATGDWMGRTVGEIWRTPDGVNWEPVTQDGFGQPGLGNFLRFAIFNEMLYVSASMQYLPDETPVGGQIWRSASGAAGDWEKVVDAGLGDPLAVGPNSFIVFKGALYAAVETDWVHPSRIWRTVDGVNWVVIKNDGFGYEDPLPEDAVYLDSPGSFAVFQNYLYLGMLTMRADTYDWEHPENNPGMAQIWRTKDGYNWEPVMQGGFGYWSNNKVDAMLPYQGNLYAVTWNSNPAFDTYEEGMQVWRSADGVNWTQINESGFGDPYNWTTHLVIDMAVYQGDLYIGTLNDLGGQVWVLSKK